MRPPLGTLRFTLPLNVSNHRPLSRHSTSCSVSFFFNYSLVLPSISLFTSHARLLLHIHTPPPIFFTFAGLPRSRNPASCTVCLVAQHASSVPCCEHYASRSGCIRRPVSHQYWTMTGIMWLVPSWGYCWNSVFTFYSPPPFASLISPRIRRAS